MTSRHNQSLGTQLGALASFLPGFEAPGFAFTLSHAPREWSESALHFVRTAYAEGWVLTGFDWPSCKDTPEALGLRDDPKVLKQATSVQLAKLLTVLIRQDRFVEGALAGAYNSGLLTAVLRRAEGLRGEVVEEGR